MQQFSQTPHKTKGNPFFICRTQKDRRDFVSSTFCQTITNIHYLIHSLLFSPLWGLRSAFLNVIILFWKRPSANWTLQQADWPSDWLLYRCGNAIQEPFFQNSGSRYHRYFQNQNPESQRYNHSISFERFIYLALYSSKDLTGVHIDPRQLLSTKYIYVCSMVQKRIRKSAFQN